jgi:hypothetical protein
MALGIVICSPMGGRILLVRRAGAIILLCVSSLLSACFPVAFHRSETPDISRHVADAGRAHDTSVLTLAISEEYRAGFWSGLAKSSGLRRNVQPPIFVAERELRDLSAKLSRYSVDILFLGVFGGWVEKSDDRIVEICIIWPDGQFLSLGDRTADKWQRETRGSMTVLWQEQLLKEFSAAEVLTTSLPPGACPYGWASLNWDYATRQRVVAYLKKVAVDLGLK